MVTRFLSVLILTLLLAATAAFNGPTKLVISRDVRRNLDILADGLRTEVVVCLTGHVNGDTGYVTGMLVATMWKSTPRTALAASCPLPETIALWHNHPSGDHPISLLYQCALSGPDIQKVLREKYPFVVVQPRSTHLCWWTREQIKKARGANYLSRVHGQYDIRDSES